MENRPLRSFGRIKARALKPRQQGLVDSLLPHLAVPEEGAIELETLFSPLPGGEGVGGEGPDGLSVMAPFGLSPDRPPTQPSPHGIACDPDNLEGPTAERSGGGEGFVLEIGFGGGEHLVAQANARPQWRFIGVEPFLNGVGSCLRHIEESGVQNVRLHMGDARDVVSRLPDACLDLVYILFPDPWPKLRHHKRRLIQADFIEALARVMKPGAELRFATDWADYADWTLELFLKSPSFSWLAERADDWRKPWPGHVTTRYEEKRLGDCAPIWFRFQRGA